MKFTYPESLVENSKCNPACHACHYKEFNYSSQIRKKEAWARQQLSSWQDRLSEIISAPENERLAYRSKSWLRAQVTDSGLSLGLSLGMTRAVYRDGRWGSEFISWDTCPLHSEPLQRLIQNLRRELLLHVGNWVSESLIGVWVGIPHVVLIGRSEREKVPQIDWANVLEVPYDQVWYHQNTQVGKNIFGHHPISNLAGGLSEQSHLRSSHPVRAFRQVAQSLLRQARDAAVHALLNENPDQIVDLYCGTGDLSLLLPSHVGWLGIELSSAAVDYAKKIRPPESLTEGALQAAYVGAVEQRLSDPRVLSNIEGKRYSLYINPPRAGLTLRGQDQIVKLLKSHRPLVIVYLSCSASSLARDLRCFEGAGWEVIKLQPYDFFPQTEHFETLTVLQFKSDPAFASLKS